MQYTSNCKICKSQNWFKYKHSLQLLLQNSFLTLIESAWEELGGTDLNTQKLFKMIFNTPCGYKQLLIKFSIKDDFCKNQGYVSY